MLCNAFPKTHYHLISLAQIALDLNIAKENWAEAYDFSKIYLDGALYVTETQLILIL
jgi:hypothetical protein